MDLLLGIGGTAAVFAGVWLLAAGRPRDRLGEAFVQLSGGARSERWPVGVQEEDRDRPWGRTPRQHESERDEMALRPSLAQVHPTVRARVQAR